MVPTARSLKTHPPKVLVTKIGLDGHDRGSRLVAAFLRDAGMEVVYTAPWQSIEGVVTLALEEDVDLIGISTLATDHLLVPKLIKALRGSPAWVACPLSSAASFLRATMSRCARRTWRMYFILVPRGRKSFRRYRVWSNKRASRRRPETSTEPPTAARSLEGQMTDAMLKDQSIQLSLPGFEESHERWHRDYAERVSDATEIHKPFGHPREASLYGRGLER